MSPPMLLLLMLDVWDDTMRGRTVVQKCAYFLSHLTDQELGFRPHYYGPFSALVERHIGDLCGLGFLEERVTRVAGGPGSVGTRLRYDYIITEDGATVAKSLYDDSIEVCAVQEAAQRIKSAGGHLRADPLSVAAKTHFVLSSDKGPMTACDIVEHARKLSWNVDEDDVSAAAEFLEKLDLVERV